MTKKRRDNAKARQCKQKSQHIKMIDNPSLITLTFIRNNNCLFANNKNNIPVHTIVLNTKKFVLNTNKVSSKNAVTVYYAT